MGLTHPLWRLAQRAEARVFCVAASQARDAAHSLRLAPGIHLAMAPRAANILLLVDELDPGLVAPALVAHDALAQPRATIWWRRGARGSSMTGQFPDAVVVDDRDPVAAVRRVHEELITSERGGDPPLLPDVEPATWRGIGPYGQGGKAMTGGVPYGRPLAERADDRDGLKLDRLHLRIGPFFAAFPQALALDVNLQGDVIQEAALESFASPSRSQTSIFDEAVSQPVALADLELARARSHLRWLADAVAVSGSASLASRVLRLAERVAPGDGGSVRALERSLRRRGFLTWATRGVGVIPRGLAEDVSGPVARASGSSTDHRTEEPAYRRIGFEPVVQDAGDAAARWRQRLHEAAHALDLADAAGDARAGGSGAVESPRGSLTRASAPSAAITTIVGPLLAGMEWGDAVTTIVSLDLDASEMQAPERKAAAS